MEITGKLTPILYKYLNTDKRHVIFFIQIILSLFKVQTINLKKLSESIESKANTDSRYRRTQRFFSHFRFDYNVIAKIIYFIFDFSNLEYYLILDRTNWKFGKANINILFLCLSYKNIAMPIYIRVRKSDRLSNNKKVCSLFYNLPLNAVMFFKNKTVNKIIVNITGVRLSSKELLIIVTNKDSASAVEAYKKRWQIETLFSCLKSKGFNFEDTHITKLDRIKKLVAVLAITFSTAYIFGKWRHENIKTITIKKHGRPQYSYFRYGLIFIRDHIFTGKKLIKKIRKIFDM